MTLGLSYRFSSETAVSAGLKVNEVGFYGDRAGFRQLFQVQKVFKDPRFLMANGFQGLRSMRLTIRWLF